MDRHLVLYPWPAAELPAIPADAVLLAPNARAGQRFDGASRKPASLESLARELLAAAGRGVAPALVAHRALNEAASELIPQGKELGLASALAPGLRSLFRAGADLERLRTADSPRVIRLAHLALAYRARLAALDHVDGAEVLTLAAGLGAPRRRVFVTGYPRLGTDDIAFLDAIAGPGSVVRLPVAGLDAFTENLAAAEAFRQLGWSVERPADLPAMPLATTAARAQAHELASREEEVRHVLARVKGLLADGVDPADVALVVRDDEDYGPLMLAVAWEYQVPLRAFYAVPLARTRLGVWLDHVLAAVEDGLRFESTFRAFDHPLGPGLATEAWKEARRLRPVGEAAWRDLGVAVDDLRWPASAPRKAWARRLAGLLGKWGVRKHAARWPNELMAVDALRGALEDLATPADEVLARDAFVDEVREALRLLTAPAQPGRGGVELHTPFALYGAAYPHVFVLGLAEGVMPTAVSDDPALDFHERRQLADLGVRLEDAVGAARRERLSFFALLEAAVGSLTLTYARHHGKNEHVPSDYFHALGVPFTEPPQVPVASAEEARRSWAVGPTADADPLTPRIRHALAVERGREGDQAPDEYDGVVGVELPIADRVFSATQLTAIGQCPFKWFATWGLRLRPPKEADEELTPSVRGTLFHKVLELAGRGALNAADPRAVMLDALPEAFLAAEQALELQVLPAWKERREEYLTLLRRAIGAEDFLAPGATLHDLEVDFAGTWFDLKVAGKVDRVDRDPDGKLSFVDYKTGGSAPKGAQDANGKAKVDVQLPLYLAAAAPPGAPVRRAYYYSLSKAKIVGQAVDGDPGLEALAATIKRRLKEGDFPVAPDVDREACTYCDHQLLCRQGARLARKGVGAAESTKEDAE